MTSPDAPATVRLGLMKCGGLTVGMDVTCVAEVCPVRKVSALLTRAPGLLGAIDLRGDPIPLFDPRLLAGLDPSDDAPQIAVIAAKNGRRIALGFDAIEGLIEVGRERLERFRGSAQSEFAGTVEERGRIVSVLEPRAILSRPDIPTASVVTAGEAHAAGDARSHLTVESGGARFGIPATDIEATVPRLAIEPHSLANGGWLGVIRHHGRRIPVMHLNSVLGLGAINDLATAEVVIVRLPERRLLGFAVETIRRMQMVALAREEPVPALLAQRTAGIRAVLRDGLEGDTFLVDVGALAADEALFGIAGLSDTTAEPVSPSPPTADPELAGAAIAERDRYLVARAGAPVAIPICHIARIVNVPDVVTPLARAPAWMLGVFREGGATIPMIDLALRLGSRPTETAERSRVLIAGSDASPLGFLVDGVDHLEWSSWRSSDPRADTPITGMVSLPRLVGKSVLPVIDLMGCDAAEDGHSPDHRS